MIKFVLFLFSQNLLIKEMRLKAFSGDIIKLNLKSEFKLLKIACVSRLEVLKFMYNFKLAVYLVVLMDIFLAH